MFEGWERSAAGILIVSVAPDGEPVVLLGRDDASKGGRWSDFAGGSDEIDETIAHTATRELREEAGDAVVVTVGALRDAPSVEDETPSGKKIVRFVVRVPFDPSVHARFRRERRGDGEKTDLRWFSLRHLPPMRLCFARQMARDASRILELAA